MGEVVEHLIEHGHRKEAILNEYTIDQLWLFYYKSNIIRRKKQYEDAIVLANCVILGNPYGGKEAGTTFKKFLNSLLPEDFRKDLQKHDLEDMKRVRSKSPPEIHKTFQQMGMDLGVPMKTRKKKPPKPDKPDRPKVPKPKGE